jgi:hypothetical protein
MKIFIAMALGRGVINADTAKSVLRLSKALAPHGIEVELQTVSFAEVVAARDMLADSFLASDCDQMLFVDDDMDFHPQIVADMIAIKKPFVGALYPMRSLDLKVFGKTYAEHPELGEEERLEKAKSAASQFVGYPKVKIADNPGAAFLPASQAGTGLLLLHRTVFEQLLEKDKSLKPGVHIFTGKRLISFFQRVFVEKEDGYLSEDFSFCYRWRNVVKGEIWLHVKGGVGHTGSIRYEARPRDKAKGDFFD